MVVNEGCLIIEGPAGVGKSWLACALGQKACRDNPLGALPGLVVTFLPKVPLRKPFCFNVL
jgi:DNA replication protein DnaC